VGFSLTEGIIGDHSQINSVDVVRTSAGIEVPPLARGRRIPRSLEARRRPIGRTHRLWDFAEWTVLAEALRPSATVGSGLRVAHQGNSTTPWSNSRDSSSSGGLRGPFMPRASGFPARGIRGARG